MPPRVPLPITQYHGRDGIIDLGWGHPHPDLLPVDAWAHAYGTALREHGAAALAYGYAAGPGPLIEWLAHHLDRPERDLFITAGASHALDMICAVLLRPGDTVLVDIPTYHLALRILGDHGAALVPVSMADPGAVADRLAGLRARGRRVPLGYLVATHNNPTGASLGVAERAALVEVARQYGVVLVEDDTYRELSYDGPAPPALRSLAEGGEVIRIGSFAKTVAPGLRLGFVDGPADLVARLARRGAVDSGGGVNHTTALAMAAFGMSGAYAAHLSRVLAAYRTHRDRLVEAVGRHLRGVVVPAPAGGWFLWLPLPTGVDAAVLLPVAERHGVSYVEGARFCGGGEKGESGSRYARLSYSMLAPDLLDEGVRRLAVALGPAHS